MPIGLCPHCQRRFVIEDERSSQRTCPRCLHPMRLPPREEPALEPPSAPHPALSATPDALKTLYLNGEPLAVNEVGQRLLAALAEAGYQRDVAQQLRHEARHWRGKADPAPVEAGAAPAPPSVLFPEREAPPPPGPRGGFLLRQAERLQQQTVNLTGKARAACIEARIIHGQ